MSQESERMLELLQEVAALKEAGDSENGADATACRQRRKKSAKRLSSLLVVRKKESSSFRPVNGPAPLSARFLAQCSSSSVNAGFFACVVLS
jgi:hypothetical protein